MQLKETSMSPLPGSSAQPLPAGSTAAGSTAAGSTAARPGAVLAVVCLGVVLATLDLFIVNIAFPAISRSFGGAGLASLSWVLNAYAIVFAALLVPAGRLADLAGRKATFLAGVAIFTVASGLCALAGGVGLLVAARVLQAAGAALLTPASLGLLLAAFPPERRTGAVRIWGAMSGVAAAIGPVAGGLLVNLDWRWIFLVNVPVGVVALLAGARLLPSPPRQPERLPDLTGALALALAVGALTLGLVRGQEWGWLSTQVAGCFAGSAVLLAGFVARSARHPRPILELGLLRVPGFAAAAGAMLLFNVAFAAMLLSAVTWMQTAWGWSALRTGLAFAPGPLMVPPVAILAGRLAQRVGAGVLSIAGCLACALGAVTWVTAVDVRPHYLTALLPGSLLTGIGVGLVMPTLTAAAATALPPHRFATGSAVVAMARQVGATLGVAGLVVLLGTPRTAAQTLAAYHRGWAFVAVASAAAALASLALLGRPGQRPGTRSAAAPAGAERLG
jgi:EmrB/QacA subfamily drug resistance transporter